MVSLVSGSAPKWRIRTLLAVLVFTLVAVSTFFWTTTQMPLRSYRESLPPLTAEETELRGHLSEDIRDLSVTIGDRSFLRPRSLQAAADYLSGRLREQGYAVTLCPYSADGLTVNNLEATLPGTDSALGQIIVAAHYDSIAGTAGANDNGSGVAGVLEVARLLRQTKPTRTIRFVFFVNEEPPYFQTEKMGSRVYAHQLRHDGVPVSAMISLETIGFYSDQVNSQKYPPILNLFYPNKGNFIAFVGNTASRKLVREAIRRFRESTRFPSEGIAAPSSWQGIGWSDQWSFWEEGYPGIMITDTAPFRYPYYHTTNDTTDKIDFDRTARVVGGISKLVEAMAISP
jgi:hypothetical protein